MKYSEAMANGLVHAMRKDPKVMILGEGVTDPKGIFGTTLEAARLFPDRTVETPLSENMLTGACVGLALEGWKPVMVHARVDFMMLAMEHLINTAAKWRSIHRGRPFAFVVRALVGRGWGQGPNHSQALHAMFAHVPGLRVLYPVRPEKVGSWLQEALTCGWPTVILEPRRLYDVESVDYPMWERPDVFIVTFGDAVLDAAQAARELDDMGVRAQVDPIEDVTAMKVPQTDVPVVVVDTGHLFCGAAAEVVARLAEQGNVRTRRVGPPFLPLPTSVVLEREWYPAANDIIRGVSDLLDLASSLPAATTPGEDEFKGPF